MKTLHLKQSREFASVLRERNTLRGRTVEVSTMGREGQKGLRVGLIVSKKTAGIAVRRNYLKRVIYRFFQDRERSIDKGTDVVVRLIREVKNERKKQLSEEIRSELKTLLQKGGI